MERAKAPICSNDSDSEEAEEGFVGGTGAGGGSRPSLASRTVLVQSLVLVLVSPATSGPALFTPPALGGVGGMGVGARQAVVLVPAALPYQLHLRPKQDQTQDAKPWFCEPVPAR